VALHKCDNPTLIGLRTKHRPATKLRADVVIRIVRPSYDIRHELEQPL
jgi:hypothetical protein